MIVHFLFSTFDLLSRGGQMALQWRRNEHEGVSNHQSRDCLLDRLLNAQIKENIKGPRHWPLCGEFPAKRASNTEKLSILWRHPTSQQAIIWTNDG